MIGLAPDLRIRCSGRSRRFLTSSGPSRNGCRERQIFDRYAERLIDLIAKERRARPDDLEPLVIARALTSRHRALIDHVRKRVLAGASTDVIAREIRTRGRRAVALIRKGLDHRSS
jgi:hypothetical protein